MMRRATKILGLLVIFLLIAGWALFVLLNFEGSRLESTSDFQAWFWERRGLDLVVQVLLVFSGALGIAAILPEEDD
jgi:multisubunit Na+/H+ antiporter MnhB subunit